MSLSISVKCQVLIDVRVSGLVALGRCGSVSHRQDLEMIAIANHFQEAL